MPPREPSSHLGPADGDRFEVALAQLQPALREGFAYWASKGWPARIPARRDIEPSEIPSLLPFVILLDVATDPPDFHVRLMGTQVVYHQQRDDTGRRMSDIPHQRPPSLVWTCCRRAVETGQPVLGDIPYVGPHRDFVRVENVILPLSTDGAVVDKLLVILAYVRTLPERPLG